MRLEPNSLYHHLVRVVLLLVVRDDYLNINRLKQIWQVCLLLLDHPYDMISVDAAVGPAEARASFGLLFDRHEPLLLLLLLYSLLLFFLCLSELAPHLVDEDSFLLFLSVSQLLLLLDDLSSYLCVLELLLLLELNEVILKRVHESLDVLVRSQLATVADLLATEWALLFAEAVVGLDASVAEAVQATLVYDWVIYHLLADWASQVFGDAAHEVLTDHVVKHEWLRSPMGLVVLVIAVVDLEEIKFSLAFALLVRHLCQILLLGLACLLFFWYREAIKEEFAVVSVLIEVFDL